MSRRGLMPDSSLALAVGDGRGRVRSRRLAQAADALVLPCVLFRLPSACLESDSISCGDRRAQFVCREHRFLLVDRLAAVLLVVNVHRNRAAAAVAADRIYRLVRTPMANLFRVPTQLELRDDPSLRPALLEIVKAAPQTCTALELWYREVGPTLVAPLVEARDQCFSGSVKGNP